MSTQTPTIPEKVLDFIGYSTAALEKADAMLQSHEKQAADCAALIPTAVAALVDHERIREDQREKAAELLKDPVKTLQLLIKVAGHRNAQELAHLGTGVDSAVKTASGGQTHDPSQSLSSPFVGQRTTRVKQSSVNLFRGLGLPDPTSE